MPRCQSCGRELDEHERDVRFGLPDPVLRESERITADQVWMSHKDAGASVMMEVEGVGAFVRSLLPVRLTGGYTVTFGVWVGIDPADLRPTFDSWWEPEYSELQLSGQLANDVSPWQTLGAPVDLAVRDQDQLPYCVGSEDPTVRGLLADEWDHELVLSALPGA